MVTLFDNAVASIKLGVEDYSANSDARALSAARNFYAGALLLGKEALRRKAPNADIDDILAAHYAPSPDGQGGVQIKPAGHVTIDFQTISRRFKDLGIDIAGEDLRLLESLGRIRNQIEHKFSSEPHEAVRDAIAKAFPVVLTLFHLCGEDPAVHLEASFTTMLEIREAYEREREKCIETFKNVDFPFGELSEYPFFCAECGSELIAQVDSANSDHSAIVGRCKSCGVEHDAETLIESALAHKYYRDMYLAQTDGGETPLGRCPECGVDAYVFGLGCVWCAEKLGHCARCGETLTPDNAAWNSRFCGYYDHVINKDD